MSDTARTRREDDRFLVGNGSFSADIASPDCCFAAFLRSPVPHALLRSLDVSAAAAIDGVVAVLTADSLAADGIEPWSAPMRIEGPDGDIHTETPRGLLVADRIRCLGEPIAMVVARTRMAANDAVEAIAADFETLDPVVSVRAASRSDAPAIWDDRKGNVAYRWQKGDRDAVDRALSQAAHVARLNTTISRVMAAPLETRNALAVPGEPQTVLYLSHQNAQAMRQVMANALNLDPALIRVHAPDVGGSFGMKSGPQREEILVFWAARKLGVPVRWQAERVDSFLSDEAGRDVHVTAELGLDAEGRFTALNVSMVVNVGAYASGRSAVPVLNIGGIAGVYRTPLIAGAMTGIFTNTAPTAPYRGAGRPEATFAIERLIDVAARETGRDALALRLTNAVPAEAMPYATPFLFEYDSGDFTANMRQAADQADYHGFADRRRAAESRGMLRGIGISNPIEVAGGPFGRPGADYGEIEVHADGSITLLAGAMSAGQGLETAMVGIAADRLGLNADDFRYVQGDTGRVPRGKGMGGSSGMTNGGSAILHTAEALIETARELAARELEVSATDLDYADGHFVVVGTDRAITLASIAAAVEQETGGPLRAAADFKPDAPTYPNGCHICEVEIDPETGACHFVAYCGVEDIGNVLFPVLATGQIHGGVAQGLGQVLCEAVQLNAGDGQMLSGSFMDYAMPRADDIPEIDCAFAASPTGINPLGVKGVGEAGSVGALAAGMNAICDALASAGVTAFDMPATPARIWEALSRTNHRSGLNSSPARDGTSGDTGQDGKPVHSNSRIR